MKLFSRAQDDTASAAATLPEQDRSAPTALNDAPPAPVSTAVQLYLILFPEEVEDEILATLEAAGVPGYTEFPKMIGRGRRMKHFNNPIWPGAVGGVITVITAEQANALIEPFRALHELLDSRSKGLQGLHMFMLPCSQVI